MDILFKLPACWRINADERKWKDLLQRYYEENRAEMTIEERELFLAIIEGTPANITKSP